MHVHLCTQVSDALGRLGTIIGSCSFLMGAFLLRKSTFGAAPADTAGPNTFHHADAGTDPAVFNTCAYAYARAPTHARPNTASVRSSPAVLSPCPLTVADHGRVHHCVLCGCVCDAHARRFSPTVLQTLHNLGVSIVTFIAGACGTILATTIAASMHLSFGLRSLHSKISCMHACAAHVLGLCSSAPRSSARLY